METLKVKNMLKNKYLAKAIADAGWGEFVRQIEYKSKIYSTYIERVGVFYPSSKLCSVCGFKNTELKLKDRNWLCSGCETKHDRDINAAMNLKQYLGLQGNKRLWRCEGYSNVSNDKAVSVFEAGTESVQICTHFG